MSESEPITKKQWEERQAERASAIAYKPPAPESDAHKLARLEWESKTVGVTMELVRLREKMGAEVEAKRLKREREHLEAKRAIKKLKRLKLAEEARAGMREMKSSGLLASAIVPNDYLSTLDKTSPDPASVYQQIKGWLSAEPAYAVLLCHDDFSRLTTELWRGTPREGFGEMKAGLFAGKPVFNSYNGHLKSGAHKWNLSHNSLAGALVYVARGGQTVTVAAASEIFIAGGGLVKLLRQRSLSCPSCGVEKIHAGKCMACVRERAEVRRRQMEKHCHRCGKSIVCKAKTRIPTCKSCMGGLADSSPSVGWMMAEKPQAMINIVTNGRKKYAKYGPKATARFADRISGLEEKSNTETS